MLFQIYSTFKICGSAGDDPMTNEAVVITMMEKTKFVCLFILVLGIIPAERVLLHLSLRLLLLFFSRVLLLTI